MIRVATDVYPAIEQVSFFVWGLYEETYCGHMANIRRFRALILYNMSCVRSYVLPSNSRCSHDILHFVQGIWLFFDVFVPLYMTIRFGIGLFAAWHFSLPHLQLDRIVILSQICFVSFPDKSAVHFFGKHLYIIHTSGPCCGMGALLSSMFFLAEAKDQLGF